MPTAVEHGLVGREPGGNATLQSESRYTSDSDWRTASWLLTFQHDGSVNRQAVALVLLTFTCDNALARCVTEGSVPWDPRYGLFIA